MGDRPATARRRHPVLHQVNARTAVRAVGPHATLDDLDDTRLDTLVPAGADWCYLLGVWQTGPVGAAVSRADAETVAACRSALPDLGPEDICGSCFAVTGYRVHDRLGGDGALARLRARLARRGVALMLDFVPNHTALDHPWVALDPDRYVNGTEDDLAAQPGNWVRVDAAGSERILAHGRDPNFPGWTDTLQLDHSSASTQTALRQQLLAAADRADGLRCDMAMLLLPEVFERTWGRPAPAFWPTAIAAVKARHPGFTFLAEVYWGLEPELAAQGFDFTYDKDLYDRLAHDPAGVRANLSADPEEQARTARFLENHDEPRAALTFGTGDRHRAAAVVALLGPGLRFLQHGQLDGWTIHVPMHLCRAPDEEDQPELRSFYDALLAILADPVLHDGQWRLLDRRPAWDGNPSHEAVVAFAWTDRDGALRWLMAVNLAPHRSQAYVPLPALGLTGRTVVLDDQFGRARYERDGSTLANEGLYLDVPPWVHHAFRVG